MTWKDSFERLNTELELTKRKKQALDDLHGAGRISQFVYECLKKELTEDIEQIEARRRALTEKMTRKLNELEEQRIALEIFLAHTEMAYAAGEIDGEIYTKEGSALDLGLEATRTELNWIKEVIVQLIPKGNEPAVSTPSPTPSETAELASSETSVEKTTEASSSVPIEVPVAVTTTTSEVRVEQVQVPTETTPVTAPAPTQDEKKEAPV